MIIQGETVPLRLQVYDGRDDLVVKVIVRDPIGLIIFQGELDSIGAGIYQTNVFKMTTSDFVMAQYIVYDGKTESKDYERTLEVFGRDKTSEWLNQAKEHSETFTRGLFDEYVPKTDDFLIGTIEDGVNDGFIEGMLNGATEAQGSK